MSFNYPHGERLHWKIGRKWVWLGTSCLALLFALVFTCFWASYSIEHWFRGFPSSYWAERVRRWHKAGLADRFRSATGIERIDDWLSDCGLAGMPRVLVGQAAAIPVLLDILKNPDSGVRLEAAEALFCHGDDLDVQNALIKALHDPNIQVRRWAFDTLRECKDCKIRVIEELTTSLKDPETEVVCWAAFSLEQLIRQLPPEEVITLLDDSEFMIRYKALKRLEEIGDQSPATLKQLASTVAHDESWEIKAKAAELLQNLSR
jgi:hypothetical protein